MRSHLPPPRTRVLNALQRIVIIVLLLQNTLPVATAAYAAPPTEPAPLRELSPAATNPTDLPQAPPAQLEEDIEIAPALDDRPAPEPVLPVPLFLTLESDRTIIRPGERLRLTVNAWRATTEKIADLPLLLELPAELMASRGERTLLWRMPELGETEIFSQSVEVQLLGGAFPFDSGVVTATVHSAATTTFRENRAVTVLGIEARSDEPPVAEIARGTLQERGLVLRGRHGDVTLLIEEGSAATTTDFTYTDGYRLGEAAPPLTTTTPLTGTAVVSAAARVSGTAANLLYLPLVSAAGNQNVRGAATPVGENTPRNAALPEDNGVSFARRWTLEATYQGQRRSEFAKWLHMEVDATWLIEQGFEPLHFTLYTRESPDQPWTEVPTTVYDEKRQLFRARIPHFSEYGLGLNNAVVGESLPDVSSFSTDLFTGAATVNYPIEVPAGAGGIKPGLGLHYSSATVDTFRWDNYKNTNTGYRVQAGLAGLGWDIGGVSYIAFASEGEDPNSAADNLYSIVLNGTSTILKDGQTVTESFAKIHKDLTTVTANNRTVVGTGEWSIATTDGTVHYFGGPAISPVNSADDANQGVILWNPGANTYRVVNKWYLRKSVDPNGNYIEYNYASIAREMHCSTNSNYNPGWYYQAIRPTSITWGGNEQTGAGHKMRVLFTYEDRDDYQIYQYDNVCTQSMYQPQRLQKITVQVYSASAWRNLREYELGYSYSSGYHQHSRLMTIKHYGFSGDGTRTTNPLNTYSFTYNQGAIHSEIYLTNANNGWGGSVDFTYDVPTLNSCHVDHNAGSGVTTVQCDTSAWRRRVATRRVNDGTGTWVQTNFSYGSGLTRTFENDPADFLGYPWAASTTYVPNSTTTEAKRVEVTFYRNNGYATDAAIAENPDPRLGRSDYERVLQPGTTGCANVVGSRCKMAETDSAYTALTGSGTSWSATSSYTARPRWVRLDSVVNWADGAAVAQIYSYETSKQNNQQFGNVT
ncbi:MAG: hypothetical protein KDE53_19310, partial [Caldilineaceae bacterium]|nr:hypothetical protein [Caldilineaceae bacterium]